MGLEEYRSKRDFQRTPEPAGGRPTPTGRRYLIQKHAARRLHYDLRLEHNGVLLSWALPRGPSFDPAEKRLAVQTEDHPIEYGQFEGIIPAGEYGGGTVMLWDQGEWEPISEFPETLTEGNLKFRIHGTKLHGAWALIRMGGAGNESGKNWLFLKETDAALRREEDGCIVDEQPFSVVTGRSMKQIEQDSDLVWTDGGPQLLTRSSARPAERRKTQPIEDTLELANLTGARRRAVPDTLAVQSAASEDGAPSGDDWLHEMRFTGQRLVLWMTPDAVTLSTPDGADWTARLPRVAVAASRIAAEHAVLDGHLVFLDEQGVASRTGFDRALEHGHYDRLLYFAYDLLYAQGFDLRKVALEDRKALLQQLLAPCQSDDSALRFSDHIVGHGETVLQQAAQLGAVGIISKQRDGDYVGRRSRNWLDIACAERTNAPADAGDSASQYVPAVACIIADVKLSNPNRILYPEQQISKRLLALFHEAIAEHSLPHLVERPLSLYRCPKGIENDGFFHKHLDEAISPHLYAVPIPGEEKPFISVRDTSGLIALSQMSVLEIHPWGSRIDKLDNPDRIILDLDPGPNVPWSAIAQGALQIRDVLHILGLQSWVKTTGGKGLHVVVPLERSSSWDDAKRFTQSVAQFMVRADPTRYVFTISKAERPGKILIDYLRNTRGATAVAPFSTRARPAAAVSTPLHWDELDTSEPIVFDVRTIIRRLACLRTDPWDGFFECRQALTPEMKQQLDAQK